MKDRLQWGIGVFPFLFLPSVILWLYWPALTATFWLDDWQFLGPRAAQEFLQNPFSIFTSIQVVHYAPVTRLYYSVLSVMFGVNPLPYHAVCLALLAVSGIVLNRFLLYRGVSPLPALFAATYFSISVSHLDIGLWIAASNYILLGIFLLLGMWGWEAWIRGGGRRDLALALFWGFLAQWTHTLGVLFPILLLVGTLVPGKWDAVRRKTALQWGAGCLAAVAALQWGPRLLIPGGWAHSELNRDWFSILKTLGAAFTQMTVPSFLGRFVEETLPGALTTPPAVYPWVALAAVAVLAMAGWFWHRRHWRLLVTGLILVVGGWILPILVVPGSEWFPLRNRYHYIPDLGFALALAAFFDLPAGFRSVRLAFLRHALPASALALFLYQSTWNIPLATKPFLWEGKFINDAALGYAAAAKKILSNPPCAQVRIYDAQLEEALPSWDTWRLLIVHLDHATIHRFYFGHQRESMSRVSFIPTQADPGHPPLPEDCAYLAWGGRLYPLKR